MKVFQALSIAFALMAGPVAATNQISLGAIPTLAEAPDRGIYPQLVRALADVTGTELDFVIVPYPRSIHNVEAGNSIAHLPVMNPENGTMPGPGLTYSSRSIYPVPISIFHRPETEIDVNALHTYRIETGIAHVRFYDFVTMGSSCIPCSLKKVASGRIDAVIFSARVARKMVADAGLTDLVETTYMAFPVHFVIAEGDTETDALLTRGLDALAADGRLKAILGELLPE